MAFKSLPSLQSGYLANKKFFSAPATAYTQDTQVWRQHGGPLWSLPAVCFGSFWYKDEKVTKSNQKLKKSDQVELFGYSV